MKISFLQRFPKMEEELKVPEGYHIVSEKDHDKILVFLVRNPIILQGLLGREEFERQWEGPCPYPVDSLVRIPSLDFPTQKEEIPKKQNWFKRFMK
jgi:hypothetical protein